MAEVIIPGPGGRIEGRYHKNPNSEAPLAVILHLHPLHGGNMHNKVVFLMYQAFLSKGFTVLRFNFRGVGKSEGVFDNDEGALNDAGTVLDWLQVENPQACSCWIAGASFGTWIAAQLLMQRSELDGLVALDPFLNMADFKSLIPQNVSSIILQGDKDGVISYEALKGAIDLLPNYN